MFTLSVGDSRTETIGVAGSSCDGLAYLGLGEHVSAAGGTTDAHISSLPLVADGA